MDINAGSFAFEGSCPKFHELRYPCGYTPINSPEFVNSERDCTQFVFEPPLPWRAITMGYDFRLSMSEEVSIKTGRLIILPSICCSNKIVLEDKILLSNDWEATSDCLHDIIMNDKTTYKSFTFIFSQIYIQPYQNQRIQC